MLRSGIQTDNNNRFCNDYFAVLVFLPSLTCLSFSVGTTSNPAETVPRPVPMNNVSEKQIKQLSQNSHYNRPLERSVDHGGGCGIHFATVSGTFCSTIRGRRGGPNLHLCRILCLLWFELCPKTESVNEEKQIFSSTVQTHKSILHLSSSPKPHLKLSALLYQSDSRIEICRLRNWGILALTSVVACYWQALNT